MGERSLLVAAAQRLAHSDYSAALCSTQLEREYRADNPVRGVRREAGQGVGLGSMTPGTAWVSRW